MTDRVPHYHTFETAGWRGRLRDDAAWWAEADPLIRLIGTDPEPIKESNTVRTLRVDSPHGDVYARHMTGLKSRRDGRLSPLEAIKWTIRPSRALRTLAIHRKLQRAGIRVASVVLAARRRSALAVEELLIADALPGHDFVELCKSATDLNEEAALLRRAGRAIAQLHLAGFAHGDMLPGNMLVLDDDAIGFIDNERTRRLGFLRPTTRRRRNLIQMVSRLMPRSPYWMIREFFAAYYDTLGVSDHKRRTETAAVVSQARRRRQRIDAGRRSEGLPVRRFRRKPES